MAEAKTTPELPSRGSASSTSEVPIPADARSSDLARTSAAGDDQHPNTNAAAQQHHQQRRLGSKSPTPTPHRVEDDKNHADADADVDAASASSASASAPASASASGMAMSSPPPPSRHDTHRESSTASSSHRMAISDDDEQQQQQQQQQGLKAGAGSAARATRMTRREASHDLDEDATPQQSRKVRAINRLERSSVLDEAAKRRHRRRPSTDSASTKEDEGRSRTPSPILGRATSSTSGHLGAPIAGPSAADIQSILYSSAGGAYGSVESAKPQTFSDSSEINAVVSSVESMDLRDHGESLELAAMVRKLGQHALEQDAYIRSMEESMHNTRVTAVSVISNLTASHAYEMSEERQLRDRLEVELEGAQASARMLSSLLAKSQTKGREMDRERAASVEDEMKWAASLPGTGLRKPSAAAVAAAKEVSAAISPRQPAAPAPAATSSLESSHTQPQPPRTPQTPSKSFGLGIMDNTPSTSSHAAPEYTDVFDSPMSAVIAERNKLAADKRYLRNRVRDAEAQLHRLESELKALRPLLVQGGGGAKAMLSTPSAPTTPHRSRDRGVDLAAFTGGSSATTPGGRERERSRKDKSARRRRPTTLGDAEAEHLLLAARRLNNVRAQQEASLPPQPPLSQQASPSARPRTPPPKLGAGVPKTPSSAATLTAGRTPRRAGSPVKAPRSARPVIDPMLSRGGEEPPVSAPASVALMGSPQAKTKSVGIGAGPGPGPIRHERVDSAASHNGMDELLHAAQSVLTPRDRAAAAQQQQQQQGAYFPPAASMAKTHDVAAQRPPSYFESPKRRRVSMSASDAGASASADASPQQRYLNPLHHKASFPTLGASPRRIRTRTEEGGMQRGSDADEPPHSAGLSALDLLADQAAASQNPSQSSEPSSSDNERRDGGFSSQEEGPGGEGVNAPRRGISNLPPRSAASSLMAARNRVTAGNASGSSASATGGAPIAYAHSVAPHSDYGSPRYSYSTAPPLPPMMGSPVSHGSSPLMSNDVYPGRAGSVGYALPPISTGPPPPPPPGMHHGHGHGHGHAHGHYHSHSREYSAGSLPPPPPPPGMPLHPQHHHHHMPPYALHSPHGLNGSGAHIPLPPAPPPGYMSPSADSPHHAANGFVPGHRHSASYDSVGGGGGNGSASASAQPLSAGSGTSVGGGKASASSSSSASNNKPKGGNTSPDKRLPYVRWTSEEDEKLKRAIAQYGQRWEAVAKAVGTRSYHQCRQRALLMRRKGVDPAAAGRGGGGTSPGTGGEEEDAGSAAGGEGEEG